MSSRQEVRVPDLGDFDDVEIVEVLVEVGATVQAEDPLIMLETDKAAMEVPSPASGKVAEVKVQAGGRVSKGDVILLLETADTGDNGDEAEASADASGQDEGSADSGSGDGDAGEAKTPRADSGDKQTLRVPDLGDFDAADVSEVHIKVGDMLAVDDPLITLETDKAAMDVPSTVAGKILSVAVSAGDSIAAGGAIAEVEVSGGGAEPEEKTETIKPDLSRGQAKSGDKPDTASSPAKADDAPPRRQADTPKPAAAAAKLPPIDESGFGKAHASPAVRKFARELGVDLARVKGSGEKSRVLKEDVKAFVKAALGNRAGSGAGESGSGIPPVPQVDFAAFGPVEVKPLGRIQKISGPRLRASWLNYPHVTQFDEADISDLERRRKKLKDAAAAKDVKLTPLAFIIKAAVIALKEFPVFNTSMGDDEQSLVWKHYFHVGFAADTPNGLVVPVIRDADLKDVMSIAKDLGELSAKAREGKITAKEMQGGSFTVSSLGGIGGTHFTPIINAPEVAILGVGRADYRPVWQDQEFVPRLILPLSLSYDHRVIDGATGVRFTTFLRDVLADADRVLLGS